MNSTGILSEVRVALVATAQLLFALAGPTAFAGDMDLGNCVYSNGLPIKPKVCQAYRDGDARDAQAAEAMRLRQEREEQEFQARQTELAAQRDLAAKQDEERARRYQAELQAQAEARAKAAAAPLTREEVAEQTKLAERCIRSSDASIAEQKAIGAEVGFVDKRALYMAAVNKLACKRHIAQLAACKKAGHCARGTSDRGPISYTLPPSDMP